MTHERKREQKPWYPTIERMPEFYNVETWQNRSVDDDPVLLEDAEAGENESVTGDRVARDTVGSPAPIAPIEPAKE
jgi:hypothetical protein